MDLPGYAKLTSMRNPAYYRSVGLLGESKPAPHAYTVVMEIDGPEAVEAELGDPK